MHIIDTISKVTNAAVLLNVVWNSGNDVFVAEDTICNLLISLLTVYFSTGSQSLWYLQQQQQSTARNQRYMCKYIPPPSDRHSVPAMVALMVQVETADGSNSIVSGNPGIPGMLKLNATLSAAKSAGFTIIPTAIQPSTQATTSSISANVATPCPSGKTPSVGSIACVCAGGYQTSGQQCTACQPGQYKPSIGAGNCIACPLGTTSVTAGASVCISTTGGSNLRSIKTNSSISTSSTSSIFSFSNYYMNRMTNLASSILLVGGIITSNFY